MILVILTSILTLLYPWNIEVGGYLTSGDWSNDQVYHGQSGYVGLDRWKKDYVRVQVNHFNMDEDWYEQWTASVDAYHWWRDELKYGADVGLLDGDRQGWFAGYKLEGVVGWVGYHVSHQYLNVTLGIPVESGVESETSNTITFKLRHKFGPFLVSAGVLGSQTQYRNISLNPMVSISGWISKWVFVKLDHGFGGAHMIVHPETHSVDLNRDETVAWYEAQTTFRLSPHVYAHLYYSRTDYEPTNDISWAYTAQYMTFGMNLRY